MNKSFDAVAWMRRQRVAMDQATKGLSWPDRRRKIEASLCGDPLWELFKNRLSGQPAVKRRAS